MNSWVVEKVEDCYAILNTLGKLSKIKKKLRGHLNRNCLNLNMVWMFKGLIENQFNGRFWTIKERVHLELHGSKEKIKEIKPLGVREYNLLSELTIHIFLLQILSIHVVNHLSPNDFVFSYLFHLN